MLARFRILKSRNPRSIRAPDSRDHWRRLDPFYRLDPTWLRPSWLYFEAMNQVIGAV
jgi:hypothetical protein